MTEDFPFDDEVLVFRVFDKIFALTNVNILPFRINLKCDPKRAIELRERYEAVQPGYHMNKKMWNTVFVEGGIPDKLIYELIDHSYDEVVKTLPKKFQEKIRQ
ncbi:MAG: MmcQ/YjbR family DNA-binding protein [Bacteroidota bacterium]|nr:MmcQ/YjbR family DNA-binding protein [Bacteroidota bacterium]